MSRYRQINWLREFQGSLAKGAGAPFVKETPQRLGGDDEPEAFGPRPGDALLDNLVLVFEEPLRDLVDLGRVEAGKGALLAGWFAGPGSWFSYSCFHFVLIFVVG